MKNKKNKRKNVWAKQIKNQINYIKKNKRIDIMNGSNLPRQAEAIRLLGGLFGAEIAMNEDKYNTALKKLDKFNKEKNNNV
jgi:hypothetical protein